MGLGGSLGWLGAEEQEPVNSASLDLSGYPIIDVHVHPPERMTLSESHAQWNGSFVDALLPAYDYPGKEDARAKLSVTFREHLYGLPRETGMKNYMARVYGVEPTLEGIDSIPARHRDGDYKAYVRSILDREKIDAIVLQSRNTEPVRPEVLVPDDRFVWTYSVTHLLQPDWAKERGMKEVEEVARAIEAILERAKSNACVGLKIPIAYYRPLTVEKVTREQADRDLDALLTGDASAYRNHPTRNPLYDDPALTAALRSYQDYLLKRIYVKAGELSLRIIIHSAVALHPALRFDYNSPLGLYQVFQDDDIKRVETKFVLIHAAYPFHHYVAAFLSQFPNVYADVSFYSNFPGTLEEILRAFLGLSPSEKIMHGSDSGSVAENIGYCAYNIRQVLAKVLRDYRGHYGWTDRDCETMARNVLSENARKVYGIDF
jgi:predicted TIM-barrel fold metal-dependent hydrolase